MKIIFPNREDAAKAHLALLQDQMTVDIGVPYCVMSGHTRDGRVALLIAPRGPDPSPLLRRQ
jgi:hypothetical protein